MIRPGRREALAQHAHERERRLDAMQDAEAHDVERLGEPVDVERVQPAVIDVGAQKLCDRPEPGTGLKVDPEPLAHPRDVLLVVDSHHPGGAPALGEKGVEPVDSRSSGVSATSWDVKTLDARPQPVTVPTRSPPCGTPTGSQSVAVLDVLDPGLAGGHPLVRRRQRDHSAPFLEASLGSIAFLVHALAIVDGHV
jgi:hypothetical protein